MIAVAGGEKEYSRAIRRRMESLTRLYYRRKVPRLPRDFPLREFAAQTWWSTGYIRHVSFSSLGDVSRFLVSRAPRHFYYSSARYDQPGAEDMDSKGWRSSDIVFDIDADHLEECNGRTVKLNSVIDGETSLIDDQCIALASRVAARLYEVLVDELGFESRSVRIEFSGHRGFHVTVQLPDDDERARAGQEYRRELVNYVRARGLLPSTIWPRLERVGRGRRRAVQPVPPAVYMAGLRGRIARLAVEIARSSGNGGVAAVFLENDPVRAAALYQNNRDVVDSIIDKAVRNASIEVDEQVTVDVKRLVRPPGSVNGKTGLVVEEVEPAKINSFSVCEVGSIGVEPVRVVILADIPSIGVLCNRIRFRKGDKPRLPGPLAAYLMAKGLASPAGDEGE